MTVGTVGEGQARIASLAIWTGRVTALALYGAVCARQREVRLRMIKAGLVDGRSLPIVGVVAARAIAAEAALVRVFVACCAVRRKAHPRVVQVLAGQQRACRSGNVTDIVTIAAANAGMLAIQREPCRRVIEPLRRRIPVDHLETHSIVVGVALDACRSQRSRSRKSGMQSGIALQFVSNFPVTVDALERWSTRRNLVALNAIRVSGQGLMRFCQGAR